MPFKRRPTYTYNPETCTYTQDEVNFLSWFRDSASYFLVTLIFCAGAFVAYNQYFYQLKEEQLVSDKSEVEADLIEFHTQLDVYEQMLDGIYERENGLYASIMESEAISPQVWEGGMGGIEKYDLENSDMASRLRVRMELLRHRLKVLSSSLEKVRFQADRKTQELKTIPAIRPVNLKQSTFISGFGHRTHPVTGRGHFHAGLDFACPTGTTIYATGNGTISYAAPSGHGYGIYVDIDHGNGYVTKYAHMSRLAVQEGQKVKRGDIIGFSGSTGLSTGPHLHYEISKNGEKVDPLDYFYDISPDEYLKKKKLAVAPAMD